MTAAKTIGIERVSCRSAATAGLPLARIRSGFAWTDISPHAVGVAGGPASVDAKIAAFRPPKFLQPLAQGSNACLPVRIVCSQHQYGDTPHTLGLLRARRERPRRCRAAELRDERAPLHSITSSARASRSGEMLRSSAFADLRFMTSSILTGNCTGRSPGFVPLRTRAT